MRQRKISAKATDDDENNEKFTTASCLPQNSSLPLKKIFILCLFSRMINSLVVQTYFSPDEHWQALEVAHHISFGYGHLTWEWKKGIRTSLHPMLFATLYRVLAFFNFDTPWFTTRAPRLLQSLLSAIGDLHLYKISRVMFGNRVAKWALFAQLVNWFMFFCITRTLANTLLERIFQHCFFWFKKVSLLELYLTMDKLKFVLLEVVPIGMPLTLHRFMSGSWVLVPLNFLKFNFLSSGGDYYGTHAWHWYITQGFTAMLFTFLPFSIAGIIMSKQWKVSGLIAWVLGIYSLIGHKEFRFVLPVLPIALMFAGYTLAKMTESDPLSIGKKKVSIGSSMNCFSKVQMPVFFLLATNLPMALYMSMVHQRGTEDEKLPKEFLVSHNFREIKRFFHAHFKVDRELQASVMVYAHQGQ
ncbi:GPI mannosyltransferase 3 [Olea europaea subsp. europaea]|uniref:Mannosyltransferase n=1 Tax=Olea europaea subsp. europaea TaxID=158383 RepID=A0A8S0RBZ9_OLEEU|nr:GPI mannosyltransferase 3 [Olea europaea subsp. europaea]